MTAEPRRSYRRLLVLAGATLFWESLWPRLWPFVTIVGLFVALAFLDVLPRLPPWLHLCLLVAFAAAAVVALIHAFRGVRLPDRAACRRRIERDSELAHRPLSTMEDRLAAGGDDPLAQSLWALHQQRLAAAATRLAVKPPSPGVPRLEPWGLRAAMILLLVIGLTAAGGAGPERLQRALAPALAMAPAQDVSVEIWITPPAYTDAAPVLLAYHEGAADGSSSGEGGSGKPVTVPAGSSLLAQVSGVGREPRLLLGDEEREFAALGGNVGQAGAYRAETTIDAGDRLKVVLGLRSLAAWPLRVVADEPPTASFTRPPEAAGNGALRLAYTASDDHGVRTLVAEIRRDAEPAQGHNEDASDDEVIRLDLALPTSADGTLAANATQDLSEHAWAGAPVRIQLIARDAIDQAGMSDEVPVVLPERTFRHPVAQAIVAERKRLDAAAPPALRAEVAARLTAIGRHPEAFDRDVVVSLALSIASARLLNHAGGASSVRGLLWATALALDEGEVPRAEQALAEAREKLREALESNADEGEIERLADALEQALTQYVDAVARELARRGAAMASLLAADAMLGSDELRDLVEMVREMARTGARDGARQLLDQLQTMLEGLRDGLEAGADPAAMAEAAALMRALRDLAGQQQGLLDETFAKMRQADNAPADLSPKARSRQGEAAAGADAQAGLRRQLGAVAERLQAFLGAVPSALRSADEAMGAATADLRRGDLEAGSDAQGRALQALREAQQGAGQAIGRQLGGGIALFPGGGRGGDVFGRSPGGRGFGIGEVEIPDQGGLRRASEILEELRRRAGERSRPEAELDYIERLLRRF